MAAAALAWGANGDDSSGGPLESALEYVPADTPFAVAIDTDVDGDQYQALDDILGRFPGGEASRASCTRSSRPFEWTFTRADLERVLERVDAAPAAREEHEREGAAFNSWPEGVRRRAGSRPGFGRRPP